MNRLRLYHSAIADSDGTVNVGNLSLFRLLRLDFTLSVLTLIAGFATQWFDEHHAFPFVGVAAMLTAIWGTFSTALGALGLFQAGNAKTASAVESVPRVPNA